MDSASLNSCNKTVKEMLFFPVGMRKSRLERVTVYPEVMELVSRRVRVRTQVCLMLKHMYFPSSKRIRMHMDNVV